MNRGLVYRWYQQFRDGDESLQNHNRTGRPVELRMPEFDLQSRNMCYNKISQNHYTRFVLETRTYLGKCSGNSYRRLTDEMCKCQMGASVAGKYTL